MIMHKIIGSIMQIVKKLWMHLSLLGNLKQRQYLVLKPKVQSEPLIVISNMRRCNKCNQEVPVRFFDAHDIDHQRSEMNQYNRRRF